MIPFCTYFGVAFGTPWVPKHTPTCSDADPEAMQASLGQVRERLGVRYIIYYVFDTFLQLPGNALGTN